MAPKRAEEQIVIERPPQECFDALTDYDSMTEWQSTVKSCEVVSRDAQGRGKEVLWEIDVKLRTISYPLLYEYDEPHLISCSYLEGDVKDLSGEYIFEDRGDGTTLATFSLLIEPGVWVPAKIAKMLNDQVMKRSLEDLKKRVESVAA